MGFARSHEYTPEKVNHPSRVVNPPLSSFIKSLKSTINTGIVAKNGFSCNWMRFNETGCYNNKFLPNFLPTGYKKALEISPRATLLFTKV